MKPLLHTCLLCLLFLGGTSFAQTTEEKAQSSFLTANDAYEKGNFTDAVSYLKQARELLGKTNTKIQYLLVKSLLDAKDYPGADVELKSYFAVTPETARDERYEEMVKNLALVEKMRLEKEMELKEQNQKRLAQIRADSIRKQTDLFNRTQKIASLEKSIPRYRRKKATNLVLGLVVFSAASYVTYQSFVLRKSLIDDYNTNPRIRQDFGYLTAKEYASRNSKASYTLIGGIGYPTSLLMFILSGIYGKELRTDKRELDQLTYSQKKKAVLFSPFYSPQQQVAGLALSIRF